MSPSYSGFSAIIFAGFGVAFLHAAIPTHWLPFVLASRANSWSKAQTLGVTGIAGLGHVSLTAVIGALIVWFGLKGDLWLGVYFPAVIASILVLIGLYFLYRQFSHQGHGHLFGTHGHGHPDHAHQNAHGHDHGEHEHSHDNSGDHFEMPQIKIDNSALRFMAIPQPPDRAMKSVLQTSGRTPALPKAATIIGLITLLTFSPCEGFMPVYLAGYKYGWTGFIILSAVLGIATVAGMLVFTLLTLQGMKFLKLEKIEKYEQGAMGAVFVLLGAAVYFFERS